MKIRLLLLLITGMLFSCGKESSTGLERDLPEGFYEGKELFNARCSACHGVDGESVVKIYPPLKDSDYLRDNQQNIPCVIYYGVDTPLKVNGVEYQMKMPSSSNLSAEQIKNLINYINNSWGNEFGEVSTEEVKKVLEDCKKEKN